MRQNAPTDAHAPAAGAGQESRGHGRTESQDPQAAAMRAARAGGTTGDGTRPGDSTAGAGNDSGSGRSRQ